MLKEEGSYLQLAKAPTKPQTVVTLDDRLLPVSDGQFWKDNAYDLTRNRPNREVEPLVKAA